MKKSITLLCSILLLSLSACQHDEIWDKLNEHDQKIEQLEQQCRDLNSNVQALQTIVQSIQQNEQVTDVTKILEGGIEVGYSITFSKSGTITIMNGTSSPVIGVKKHSDGTYYWTSDGEWMTDDNGNKIGDLICSNPKNIDDI